MDRLSEGCTTVERLPGLPVRYVVRCDCGWHNKHPVRRAETAHGIKRWHRKECPYR